MSADTTIAYLQVRVKELEARVAERDRTIAELERERNLFAATMTEQARLLAERDGPLVTRIAELERELAEVTVQGAAAGTVRMGLTEEEIDALPKRRRKR